jgi:dienelactone hydrolase
MKKNFISFCMALLIALAFNGCVSNGGTGGSFTERNITVTSLRNTQIPAILTIPRGASGKTFPAVIFAHGHGGSKDEAGGFVLLAASLAKQGIASLRLDFPGCGDSPEDFTQGNRVTYMIDDVKAAKEYLAGVAEIDTNRLGILGYSMGGRVAALTTAEDSDYASVVFWSPAISPGSSDLYAFMQLDGEAGFNALYGVAKAEGQATYTNAFGAVQTLGVGWFDDMIAQNPLALFPKYKGNVLLITGSADVIIPAETARAITRAATGAKLIETHDVAGADHGYGIYSGETALTQEAVNTTVAFFKKTL